MTMPASTLFEVIAKASAALMLAWATTRLFGRSVSAAARHQVWAAALIVSLLVPALVLYGPTWNIEIGGGRWAERATRLWSSAGGRLGTADVWPRLVSPASHAPVSTAAAVEGGPSSGNAAPRTTASQTGSTPTLVTFVLVLWAAGTLLGLLRLITGMLSAGAVVGSANAVSGDWTALCDEAQRRLGRRRSVRIVMSSQTAVPVVCGIFRPAILLPPDAGSWDDRRRRAVLCHELAHVVRHDCLIRLIAQLARALYWFNPLATAAIRALNAEQERACDDAVIKAGTPPLEYVDHLYAIVRASQPRLSYGGATVAFAERSRLHHRIEAILDDTRERRRPSRIFMSGLWVAAGTALAFGAARPAQVVNASAQLPSIAFDVVGRFGPAVPVPPLPAFRDAGADAAANGPAGAAGPAVEATRPGADGEFVTTYCVSCHNPRTRTANVDLEQFNADRAANDPELAERVVRKLRIGLHPALGVPRPERAAAYAVSGMLETVLDNADGGNWTPDRVETLTDRDVAARLSRFLWSGEPDAALIALAGQGRLRDPRTLHQQVGRMLTDARSDAFVRSFFDRWLSLDHLDSIKPEPTSFPQFDDTLRLALRKEMDLFLASQIREDHGVADLLTASYSFVDDRLAQHYGLADRPGEQFRRVNLADQARFGLLGKGAVLAVTSYATRTSPVLRGKWVLETLVGAQAPPPPPNVPALKNGTDLGSMRQRMEVHTKNPVCASCHAAMDGPGFALENFDAIGHWRNTDGGSVIDANSQMADGTMVDGPAGLRGWLAERQELVVTTATLKLLSYALERPAKLADMPTVRTILRDAAATNYRWSSLIEGVVRSQPFRTRPVGRDTTP
jgi:beta-lactamase regulating signal transducer with metallopeptidase domain